MDQSIIIYILLFASAFLGMQSLLTFSQGAVDQSQVNHRLKVKENKGSVAELIVELRRQRALDADGNRMFGAKSFNDLVTQSGLVFQPAKWIPMCIGIAVISAGAAFYYTSSLVLAGGASLLGGIVLPLFYLKMKASARDRLLGEQLPDALEVVVRSLEAGHPVPTAVSLVGREMPDPIGSEFGLASDEIAYGSSLEQAVKKLAERTRHPDVELFAATVRLQAKTGGNLAGLLKVNASTVRARQKMRLKVKAASSEGRVSAMILTGAPFMVMGAMHVLTPHFYGEVIHEPMIQIGLAGFGIWMFIGNMIMRQMINFKV